MNVPRKIINYQQNRQLIIKQLFLFILIATFFSFEILGSRVSLAYGLLTGVLFFWFLYNLYHIVRYKKDRDWRILRIALWFAVVLILTIGQNNGQKMLRIESERMVVYVKNYMSENGRCPTTIEDPYFVHDDPKIKKFIKYKCGNEGIPHLYYLPRSAMFDLYYYDFENDEWNYVMD